ncbi:zinc finger protein 22-like [Crotalus tigris]|uniref:zinc finger protein 22-like n=1 Tax=Crotalus tigris TaxID=88082 RepID=UPI00192F82A7|nr:zinc finger protein 22-like [Crotalus tigris]
MDQDIKKCQLTVVLFFFRKLQIHAHQVKYAHKASFLAPLNDDKYKDTQYQWWKSSIECPECGKGFRENSNLVNHQKTNTGEKPYDRLVCVGSFITNSHLVKHQRTHTAEKLYECSECRKSFSYC